MSIFRPVLSFLLAFSLIAPAVAQQKPLVIINGQTQRLPAGTTLAVQPSTTGAASLNIPQGLAPTSPVDGDCWTTISGVYCRISGITRGPFVSNEQDATFPITQAQAPASFYGFKDIANGNPYNTFQSLIVNGTLASTTYDNFLATATPDLVGHSSWVLRGGAGTNPIVAANFGSWIENVSGAVTWALEVDSNNEAATQAEGSDTGGVGIALNTGSTYSPDTGLWVRRLTGAGTGPGWLRGIVIGGARNVGLRIEAMSPSTYPGLSPAAPGTITALQVLVSNDAVVRYTMDESGGMSWGSGAAAQDVTLSRTTAGVLTVGGALNDTVVWASDTPTITAGSGTITTKSGSIRYNQLGKRVFFTLNVSITTNGTGAVTVNSTLPITPNGTLYQYAGGRERAVGGKALSATITASGIQIANYDNTYPGSDGAELVISGVYEAN